MGDTMHAEEQVTLESLDAVVRKVEVAAYEVSNTLGAGFFEKVYQRAMRRELVLQGLNVKSEFPFCVLYKGECVGEYVPDLLVENRVIVELKCVDSFSNEHLAQCLNYLKTSGLRLALLLNFRRPKLEWKRVVW